MFQFFYINDIRDWIIKFDNKYVYIRQTILYNGKILQDQSLNSLNIDNGVSFGVIIAKERIEMLPRTNVTIEDAKYVVDELKKHSCVVYVSENKVSSYHESIVNVYDYGEDINFRVKTLDSGIELVKIALISLNTNDGNVKRTRFTTNHYTDDYKKREKMIMYQGEH